MTVKASKTEGIYNKPLIHVLTIIFVVLLIYSNTFNASFQFDDHPNIVNNPVIKDLQYFADPSLVKSTNIQRSLIPLFKTRYIGYLTFALNYGLHGLDIMGYHLVNIFIHMFNSLLLYWFMTLTFRTTFFSVSGRHPVFPDSTRNFMAFFTALLFAVHPIQTQAVTYIVQRFTSLATLFYLLALVMYIRWKESKEQQAKRYASSVMLYAVSLFSAILAMKTKEFAFTLPVMMAMYELMFFNGKIMKRLLYLIPFFLAILLIPLSLAGTEGPLAALSGINEEAVNLSGERASISRGEYLFTQFRVIVTYIRLLFFPVNQNIDYNYPIFDSFFSPAVVLSFLFLLSIIIAGIYLYRISKRPERKDRFWLRMLSFGILWFFVGLPAESGIIPIIDVIFEHRIYLLSVGFFIAVMAAIGAGIERWGGSRPKYANKALLYVIITVVLVLSVATYARNAVWKDSLTLWKNATEGSPSKARPHHNLGLAYAKQDLTEEAIKEFRTSLKLKPDFVEAHYDLGVAYAAQGRIDEAIKEYQAAVKLLPEYAEAHNNLALAYLDQGRTDEAIREFQTLLIISPSDHPMAHKFLEFLLKKQG
jgi:hypothetical protein